MEIKEQPFVCCRYNRFSWIGIVEEVLQEFGDYHIISCILIDQGSNSITKKKRRFAGYSGRKQFVQHQYSSANVIIIKKIFHFGQWYCKILENTIQIGSQVNLMTRLLRADASSNCDIGTYCMLPKTLNLNNACSTNMQIFMLIALYHSANLYLKSSYNELQLLNILDKDTCIVVNEWMSECNLLSKWKCIISQYL